MTYRCVRLPLHLSVWRKGVSVLEQDFSEVSLVAISLNGMLTVISLNNACTLLVFRLQINDSVVQLSILSPQHLSHLLTPTPSWATNTPPHA